MLFPVAMEPVRPMRSMVNRDCENIVDGRMLLGKVMEVNPFTVILRLLDMLNVEVGLSLLEPGRSS